MTDFADLSAAIVVECDRQHVGADRHPMLFAAWERARKACESGESVTCELIEELGGLAEVDNHGKFRSTPVTFSSGGTAAEGHQVESCMQTLVQHFPDGTDPDVGRAWLREFLWVHPFTDGNGRTAWVLQQWVMNTWNNPQPLIDFGF